MTIDDTQTQMQLVPQAGQGQPQPQPQAARPKQGQRAAPADPDFVTSLFDLLCEHHPHLAPQRADLEQAVRSHFKGSRQYVAARTDSTRIAQDVLALFNGRNAREVARRLRISRATVYRVLKQAGK